MRNPFTSGLPAQRAFDFLPGRLLGRVLLLVCSWAAARAEGPAAPADFRAVLSGLVSESDRDFEIYRGEKVGGDENMTYYQAKPIPGMVPGRHFVGFIKAHYFLICDITDPASLKTAHEAFLAMPGYQDGKGVYTIEPDKAASSARKVVTNLLLNGHKVGVYANFLGETEDTITMGTYEARVAAASATPALDAKTRAFTAGAQILVRAAATNFSGMVKAQVAKTGDGDPLYGAEPVPEMQTDADSQVVMQLENRYFFMNSYDDEASVAFAFAAFQALPKNIAQDKAYEVEQDHRLDKAGSTTYHLRYNGQIVADFIKFKTRPKAYFTFGYRDGIPQGVLAGMGRTYSDQSIAEAKQMIHEATTCANCRGMGVEEIDTGWEYKSSGIHEKKWVPCHFCHGTGHL